MSSSLLNFIIVLAELGGILLLVIILWTVYFLVRMKKESNVTYDLTSYIKEVFSLHKKQLTTYFKDNLELEKNKVDTNVDVLLKYEKSIYDNLIKVSIDKDTRLLKVMVDDLHSLINDYVRIFSVKVEDESDDSKASRDLTLKKENEALRVEKASLEKRLAASNLTIENMLGEFSSMYEGGKKEGEQRVKNEMYLLKQTLKDEEVEVNSKVSDIEQDPGKDEEPDNENG